MTPKQYELAVASHFQSLGYQVTMTAASNDFGVDVFARTAHETLAIQAKMYGDSSRPVNREMILQLHGAKDYFDCTRAILVTNGRITDSAIQVAAKLTVEILRMHPHETTATAETPPVSVLSEFDRIWEQHIMPLAGQVVTTADGNLTNTILTVD